MKIPFDSFTLAAVVHELQGLVGAKAQRFVQPDDNTFILGLYSAETGEANLLVSIDPTFSRAHLVTRRYSAQPQPPGFQAALKSKLNQARLRSVEQIGLDRIVELQFEGIDAGYVLVLELMGKHSNAILLDHKARVIVSLRNISPAKSPRPISAGRVYSLPPTAGRQPLTKATVGDNLKEFEGVSPFLIKLIESGGVSLSEVQQRLRERRFDAVVSPGHGAYPVSVASLGVQELKRDSISIALEQHYNLAVPTYQADQLRHSLVNQLERVLLARDVALSELEQAQAAARGAGRQQLMGELILAYGHSIAEGQKLLEAHDYEGNPIEIKLDPELNYLDNANKYFSKAKRAKGAQAQVVEQHARLSADRELLLALLEKVQATDRLTELEELREQAKVRRWLHTQPVPTAKKEDQPYEGHRIRELMGPGGIRVLYGENATSNDYLTLRVAKPDDYWLHIRGGVSAHVVIPTQKHPEKIGKEHLMFAAKVAVQNSPSKHSGYVAVDYTLKKYVRKPKGAPAGTALYTHEKTLHVER